MCEITQKLQQKLDPSHVKSRSQGGSSVAYVEGWHVISEANRIFGFLNWSRETISCAEVSKETNAKGNFVVGYEAKVRIAVWHEGREIVREGTGSGSGISKNLFDAIEGAAKEAETDAMKRAFMTFGNPFGLALYDKSRENVGVPEPTQEEIEQAKRLKSEQWAQSYMADLEACQSQAAFFELKNNPKKNDWLKALEAHYPDLRERLHDKGVEVAARLGIGANNAANGASHATH